jgi:hypothetical protein
MAPDLARRLALNDRKVRSGLGDYGAGYARYEAKARVVRHAGGERGRPGRENGPTLGACLKCSPAFSAFDRIRERSARAEAFPQSEFGPDWEG